MLLWLRERENIVHTGEGEGKCCGGEAYCMYTEVESESNYVLVSKTDVHFDNEGNRCGEGRNEYCKQWVGKESVVERGNVGGRRELLRTVMERENTMEESMM